MAALLPKVNLHQIKQVISDKIFIADSLEEVLEVMQDEIDFHKTVNLIQTVEYPAHPNSPNPETVQEFGKARAKYMTVESQDSEVDELMPVPRKKYATVESEHNLPSMD